MSAGPDTARIPAVPAAHRGADHDRFDLAVIARRRGRALRATRRPRAVASDLLGGLACTHCTFDMRETANDD
jgi:hypothetical protein